MWRMWKWALVEVYNFMVFCFCWAPFSPHPKINRSPGTYLFTQTCVWSSCSCLDLADLGDHSSHSGSLYCTGHHHPGHNTTIRIVFQRHFNLGGSQTLGWKPDPLTGFGSDFAQMSERLSRTFPCQISGAV